MKLNEQIQAFVNLGYELSEFLYGNNTRFPRLKKAIAHTEKINRWFACKNVHYALKSIVGNLKIKGLTGWTENYHGIERSPTICKSVGVMMPGNIPLVGFNDFLCVLISGNSFIGKTSSQDPLLLGVLAELLIEIEPRYKSKLHLTINQMKGADAYILTGSNNTGRYFRHYFGEYPHIIRGNRSSIAILNGEETADDLSQLADDLFTYYGLGCRNVSKIYLPVGHHISKLNEVIRQPELLKNDKYRNNYLYNRAALKTSQETFIDSGSVLLQQSSSNTAPVAVLNYEFYPSLDILKSRLIDDQNELQCIVTRLEQFDRRIEFGRTQQPGLADYADDIDTMNFLLNL